MRFQDRLQSAAKLAQIISVSDDSKLAVIIEARADYLIVKVWYRDTDNVIQKAEDYDMVARANINVLKHSIRELCVRIDPSCESWLNGVGKAA